MNTQKQNRTRCRKRKKPVRVPVSNEARAIIEVACKQAGLTHIPPSLLVCSAAAPILPPENIGGQTNDP